MMKRFVRALMLLAAAFTAPAFANFHLWTMTELYSSPDGKVQFLELRALAGGQQFLSGHGLRSSAGGVNHDFEFNTDLGGDTSGKTFLVGTQSFAALNIVAPNYVVPDNFFFAGGGTITFAEGADVWTHGATPTDTRSLNRDGSTGTNSPKNFQGTTGTVPAQQAAAPFNVHGLWWHDPDASEGGWGINLSQQGDALFMSWFTYDTDGSNMWLYMSNTTKPATNTYTGPIFRNTGPAFDSATWNSSAVNAVSVGTGTFTFSDAGHATFQYTVNGITQTKAIKRFLYATPVGTCDETGAFGAAPNFTDLYWRQGGTESGWGLNVIHQGDILFISWFTYAAGGKGQWIFGSNIAKTATNVYSGDIFRNTGPPFSSATWDATLVHAVKVGTATLTFNGATATFAYTVDGVAQTKTIEHFPFASPPTSCRFP